MKTNKPSSAKSPSIGSKIRATTTVQWDEGVCSAGDVGTIRRVNPKAPTEILVTFEGFSHATDMILGDDCELMN